MDDDAQPEHPVVGPTISYSVSTVKAGGTVRDHRSGSITHRDASEAPDALRDRVLGDFVLREVMAGGGFGTVYRAEQRALGRSVVVKVIRRSSSAPHHAAERFAREARLASRFDHPYAAHVYAYGVEPDGLMWIAMELVDGTPLAELVRRSGPLALARFVPLFERLCDVVQSAHDQGIVHRDIKPTNVMVIERAGRLMPKLLDFGIAKRVGAGDEPAAAPVGHTTALGARGASGSLTQHGQILGSPAYMAPEQWGDPIAAGPPADQYALALLAYEALTGERAFPGLTLEVLAEQHREMGLPALPAHLPPELSAVLARASDKLAERRFATVSELAHAFRVAAGGASTLDAPLDAPPDEGCPYPGLAAFTALDHASFVGREHDVEEVIDRLDTQAVVAVVGPSGSGKSSFVSAGLLPSLGPGWQGELVRPGRDPLAALVALARRRPSAPYREALHDDIALAPEAIAAALGGLAAARDVGLVVIVDQAEELFTMCVDDPRRAAFAEVLMAAAASGRVRVVLALRDDFLYRVEQLPAWRGVVGRAVHLLGIPRRDDLERMITVPARRRGYRFDDSALPREIADAVADRPGALPLVAFAAAQLWEHRDRQHRRLTRSAYERIGGVMGALVRHADGVVDQTPVPERRQIRLVFRRLITAEGARAAISRAELESSLGDASAAAVIDRLLAARLIVSRDDDGGDRVEVIHETLAANWPRLASWRREDADGARLQDELAVAARHWSARGRPGDLLWRGDALADLRRWQQRDAQAMTPVERAFWAACFTAARRARRTRVAIVALIFSLLVAGIAVLVSANREIAEQRAVAVQRVRASFEERGRAALAEGDDARAMLYLAEASRLGAHGPAFDLLTGRAAVSLDGGLQIVGHARSGILGMDLDAERIIALESDYTVSSWSRAGRQTRLIGGARDLELVGDLVVAVSQQGDVVAVDPAGVVRWRAQHVVPGSEPTAWSQIAGSAPANLVLVYGEAAVLLDAGSGRARGELRHDKEIATAEFDADGAHVATGDSAGVVRIWNTASATLAATCEPHTGSVRIIKFSPDRRWVVSGGNDGDLRVCDAATGAPLQHLLGHSQPVTTLGVAADGRSIASGGRDGKARIWDARTWTLVRVLDGHRGPIMKVRFSPDGERLLTLGFDGVARLWDRDGTLLGALQGHAGQIYAGQWDVDGRHVITTSVDGAIRRWDAERAVTITARRAHPDAIVELAVSPEDSRVLTASSDGSAILWDRRTLRPLARLEHGGKVVSAGFAPDGNSALTTDATGTARIWHIPSGALAATLAPHTTAARYARDGSVITAGDGQVRFWTAAGTPIGAVPVDAAVRRLVLDPAGRLLFAHGETSSALVIDVATRTPLRRLAVEGARVQGLASDGATLAITDGPVIRLWQIGTWAPLGTLVGHKSEVLAVWFISGGQLVSASFDAALVWGRDRRLSDKLADPNRVLALALLPDGSGFVTASNDGAQRIWDAVNHRLLVQLPGHGLPARALALTHDGVVSISGGNDGWLTAWDLSRRTRSTAELADIVRCRVPLRLEGDIALPRDLAFDDPACRALVVAR